ncbi:hypothetical protein [Rouxiella silvae]|nr:hypothetical protein [Rouxiella silvae]
MAPMPSDNTPDNGVPTPNAPVPGGGSTQSSQISWLMTSMTKLQESHSGVQESLSSFIADFQTGVSPVLKSPPTQTNSLGGGDNGGSNMEKRLESLERKVDSIDSTLTGIRGSLSGIESKISSYDSKFERLSDKIDQGFEKIADKIDVRNDQLSVRIDNQKTLFDQSLASQSIELKGAIEKSSSDVTTKIAESKTSIIIWVVSILLGLPAVLWIGIQIFKSVAITQGH